MTELIAARDWLTVYRLPPYAHELNPVESPASCAKAAVIMPTADALGTYVPDGGRPLT